jgi:hypothetical protein
MSRIDLGDNIRKPKTVPATVEGFNKQVDSEKTGRICSELADILEQHKRGELTKEEYKTKKAEVKLGDGFYTPHAHFKKGYKSNDGEPVDSGKAIIDLDGCPNFVELYARRLMGRERELGINMVNRSVSGTGGHVLFDIPEGLDRQQAQAWMAHEMGDVEYDKAVHEPERAVYLPCREYILYIDEEQMFSDELHPAVLNEEVLRKYRDKEQRKTGKVNTIATPHSQGENPQVSLVEADERTRLIFHECMKEEGLTDDDFVNEGGRHNSVKLVLSHCNQLLTQAETLGVLKEMMPNNWQDENIQTLVADFYAKYLDRNKPLSMVQKRIFKESKRKFTATHKGENSQGRESETSGGNHQDALSRMFASNVPPVMPSNLPRLVKVVTKNTPSLYQATVAQAMFPALATYPKHLSFKYIDNQVRELRINCLIIAGTGTGKDICTKQPLTHIIADIKQRDEMNRERLKKFNEEYNSNANNKQKPQRPADLVIQTIKSDITKAALVQRMEDAQGAPLYARLNELEQWDKVEGATGRNNQFTVMKQNDDEENDFGSDRASTQSVMGSGSLHLNWNANTTVSKALRYFRYVVTDGPISRLCLATIPDSEIGSDIPVFGDYDEAYDEALKPYLDNLKEATGVIVCQQAMKLASRLKAECADFARLSQDTVFDNLSHRALVHAFRKACLLYAANGMKWEKAIEEFCRWSLFYDLYLKMKFWGDSIRSADGDVQISKRGPESLLDSLPTQFTVEDAKRVRQQKGLDAERARKMISTWQSRDYVIQMSDFSFKKLSEEEREEMKKAKNKKS